MHKTHIILLFIFFTLSIEIRAQNSILLKPVTIKLTDKSVNQILDILAKKPDIIFLTMQKS